MCTDKLMSMKKVEVVQVTSIYFSSYLKPTGMEKKRVTRISTTDFFKIAADAHIGIIDLHSFPL